MANFRLVKKTAGEPTLFHSREMSQVDMQGLLTPSGYVLQAANLPTSRFQIFTTPPSGDELIAFGDLRTAGGRIAVVNESVREDANVAGFVFVYYDEVRTFSVADAYRKV
jgi:hypothetical protein